jgi:hypothetical protein
MVKQFDNGAMRVRQPHPDVVQVGFRGQDQGTSGHPLTFNECHTFGFPRVLYIQGDGRV